MKFLVTGGAGFIGSHLVHRLVENGNSVTVLDNFATGKRDNLAPVLSKINLIEGSVVSKEDVAKAVEGMDYVLHHAAQVSVPKSMDDPYWNNEFNVTGTLNVLEGARSAGVKRVVLASSSSIYGDREEKLLHEKLEPACKSLYALSKLIGEQYCRIYSNEFGLSTVCLRYFNVFGVRQDPNAEYAAVIPKFITAALAGERPTIFGDGEQTRDFIHVDNVVEANLLCCGLGEALGEVYNIGAGEAFSLKKLLAVVSEVTDVKMDPIFEDPRLGDVQHTLADISKATKSLGFRVHIDFKEGLKRTVDGFRT